MSVRAPCGCRFRSTNNRERIEMCPTHQAEFDRRHQEAIATCSHVERLKPTHYGAQLGMPRPEIPLPEVDS